MPTTLTRWNPFTEIERMLPRDIFSSDLLGRLRPGGELAIEWSPRCDVTEKDDAIMVHAELPGVDVNDVELVVDGPMLVLRGEKRSEKEEEKNGRKYSERFFGTFERAIPIPEGVDASKIEAKMKDGVLEVRVPRPKDTTPERKKIEIRQN